MEQAKVRQVYVLECLHGKYYVGCTSNFIARLHEHMSGKGSEWTKKYKPVRVVLVRDILTQFDEDSVTKEYMLKYGIDNVRGARYVELQLPQHSKENITQDMWLAEDKCLNCGAEEHYSKDCVIAPKYAHNYTPVRCSRCKRVGHTVTSCVARCDIRGTVLPRSTIHNTRKM